MSSVPRLLAGAFMTGAPWVTPHGVVPPAYEEEPPPLPQRIPSRY